MARRLVAAAALLVLALLCRPPTAAAQPPTAAQAAVRPAQLWPELSPGKATAATGAQLLQLLEAGVGDIELTGDIQLTPQDWQTHTLPIVIPPNASVLIHSDDNSGLGLRPRLLDWGGAIGLVDVSPGATLSMDNLSIKGPGNYTRGLETMPLKNNGSFAWPTVTNLPGSALVYENSSIDQDDPRCSPQTTEAAAAQFNRIFGNGTVTYLGGGRMFQSYLASPSPVFDMKAGRAAGVYNITLVGTTSECFNSLAPASTAGDGDDGGGGGTPSWVWAVVGVCAGLAVVAVLIAAFLLHRRRHQRRLASASGDSDAEAGSGAKAASNGSGSQQPMHPLGLLPSAEFSGKQLYTGGSSEVGQFLRTRFGPIEGVQLGEMLGRGAFGRVYKGRWKGVVVAVKVVDHTIQPGKIQDLSREPLLSMSVSHPNVIATHKMCIVKISSGGSGDLDALPPGAGPSGGDSGSGSTGPKGSGSGSATAKLVRGIDGSGLVEVVSPHDVLQPGHYEVWLVSEFADRGSLTELLRSSKLPTEAAQRDVWVLLCLLDIAQGLEYLHSSGILHGDLKPQNVLLKGARSDRRGFVCKLADFGLSHMLVSDESHVETESYGTATYAAPERLLEGRLTPLSDVYSFGIIIWELVTLAGDPYPGMSSMQVSQQQLRPKLPASGPPALLDLMQRCWDRDPAARPSAADLVEELRAHLTSALSVARANST